MTGDFSTNDRMLFAGFYAVWEICPPECREALMMECFRVANALKKGTIKPTHPKNARQHAFRLVQGGAR